jgi:hypothetical protein
MRIFSYLQNKQKEDSWSTKSSMLHPIRSTSNTSYPEKRNEEVKYFINYQLINFIWEIDLAT